MDEAGKKRQVWADGFGQTIEADEPDSSGALTVATCYKYDVLNNRVQVDQGAQSGSSGRTSQYDGLSRLTSENNPESGIATYAYTSSGGTLCSGTASNPCRVTDARGVTTTYTYNSVDWLTAKSYSDATPAVSYFYEQTSCNGLTITYGGERRTCMTDGSGTTAWSYDPAGHIVTEQRTVAGVTKTTSFTLNRDGSIASKTYPGGAIVAYTYNNAQRVISIVDTANSINYAKSATYAPHGPLASVVHGQVSGGFAGITFSKTYNNRLQTASQVATSSNGTVLNLAYSYDLGGGVNNGNVTQITNNLDNTRTQNFEYDTLNRITVAKTPLRVSPPTRLWANSYIYDRYGNLLQKNLLPDAESGESFTASVDATTNRILGNSYDAAGNLTNDGSNTHDFDAEKRMKTCSGASRVFDGDDLRVQKANGELSWYEPTQDSQLMTETDSSGITTADYIFMNDVMLAKSAAGTVYYFFGDRLNSARVMTDAVGLVQQESDYYPFGGERVVTAFVDNRYKFTGLKRDSETTLDYAQERMYNSGLGRWTSTDPVQGDAKDPQSLNLYSYVGNNPTNFKDTQGTLKDEADRGPNDARGNGQGPCTHIKLGGWMTCKVLFVQTWGEDCIIAIKCGTFLRGGIGTISVTFKQIEALCNLWPITCPPRSAFTVRVRPIVSRGPFTIGIANTLVDCKQVIGMPTPQPPPPPLAPPSSLNSPSSNPRQAPRNPRLFGDI